MNQKYAFSCIRKPLGFLNFPLYPEAEPRGILLIKVSGFSLKLTGDFLRFAKTASTTLLWLAFMVIFLSENPTLGSYEPFALLFSLEGAGLQWYLLPAALIGALLVPDYYCRYFCPVGRALRLVGKFGDKARKISLPG
ncbi:MAG TPA: hypothetical protein ENI20_20205 [Bacteroides sp.]|nr:hypothetical protein [Bacteroides sp.]